MKAFLQIALAIALIRSGSAMSLSVTPSVAEPAQVGTPVTLTAGVTGPVSDAVWYRFRIRSANSHQLRVVRDFSPSASLDWVPLDGEGTYEIQVSARSRDTGETIDTTTLYRVDSRVVGGVPVITPTSNKL